MMVGRMLGFGFGIGMVAGSGRKIRPARMVTPKAAGAPTKTTMARNSEPKIVLTILQSNRIAGSASRTGRSPLGAGPDPMGSLGPARVGSA